MNIANSETLVEESDVITTESEEIIVVTKTKKKPLAIIDSDSESDEHIGKNIQNNEAEIVKVGTKGELVPEILNVPERKSKRAALYDSESSDDEETKGTNENTINEKSVITEEEIEVTKSKPYNRRIKPTIDSDTENEEQEDIPEKPLNEEDTYTLGSNGKMILETPNSLVKKNKWADLCDSESSEDEITKEQINNINDITDKEDHIQPKLYKRKAKSKGSEVKPKKMTGKDALKLRKEIQSESQRMLRETKVSLPYHKPKQFTLKEFLSKRPKLSSAVTLATKVPPSLAIKMPKEQLEIISKKLEEREKEVKEFYKSDSGSDNEDHDDPEYLPEKEEIPVDKPYNRTEEMEDLKKDNEDKEVTNKENEDKEVSNKEKEDKVANKENEDEDNTIKENEINKDREMDNLCNSEEHFDSGIDIQEVHTKLTEKSVDENESLIGDNEVEMDISEKENNQSENVAESDSVIENTPIERDINYEKVESQTSTLQETQVDKIVSSPVKGTSISEENKFSDDYEFNLDDLEESEVIRTFCESKESEDENERLQGDSSKSDKENSTKILILQDKQISIDFSNDIDKNLFKNDELDKEIEAFNIKSTVVKKELKISELLKEKLGNIMPRLSGTPEDVIDLESGVANPKEIVTLMKRFEKHTAKKQVHKNKVHLNIVSVVSQGNIEKEVVSMEIDDENSMEVEEKPGARLQRLRNELQNQIAKKKSEMWQRKSAKPSEVTTNEEDNEDEPSKPDYEDGVDDILDDEDEEEMSESSEEDLIDSDEEEDTTKEKKKSDFIDEEAEESDDEDEDNENIHDNDALNNSDKENESVDGFDANENSESTNLSEKEQDAKVVRKPLRRIVKGFTEDSDDENEIDVPIKTNTEKTEAEKLNEDDDMIPPHQIINNQTPVKQNSQRTQSSFDFDFLTPVSYITGIKNLSYSASKNTKESPVISPFPLQSNPNLLSPLKETDWQSSLQKKLFVDSEIPDSQAIVNVCSGDFPSTQSSNQINDIQVSENQPQNEQEGFCENSEPFPSSVPSSQDLLNICSGTFTGISQSSENPQEKDLSVNDANRQTLNIDESDKGKNSDLDHDVIISQLLDEEEMEKFKKKFDSPGTSITQKEVKENNGDLDEAIISGILDSDDEDEMKVKRRKNKSKLTFSDDESSEESDVEKEEEINLHDEDEAEDDEDEIENVQETEPDNIDYDSEENEIELEDDGEEEGTTKLKPSDFFDEEAELSESEWGSADEDEKDLDTLDIELGDTEKFDEKKLKRDLEKIHMRRMLDEDQREVKLLQELLLEDGELHGSGRQRQFKWKNIDTFDGEEPPKTEDDVFLDEEESEEQWRKKRYEREQFLKEKQKKSQSSESGDLLSNSQIFKIGQKVLQGSTSSSVSLPTKPNDNEEETIAKTVMSSFIFSKKRGSFLNRGEEVLQRIAEFNKLTETEITGATAKNSRRFLFQTVAVEEGSSSNLQDKKRKASDGTPQVIKKLRLSDNLSPANRKKKLVDPKAKTKLF